MNSLRALRMSAFVVAIAGLFANAPVEAGRIRGDVRIPPAGGTPAKRANRYPGRADAIAPSQAAAPSLRDAVVFVSVAPAGVKLPHVRPDKKDEALRPELGQRGQAFVPRVVAIEVGTTVEFPNHDPIYHNVFSVSPTRRFDLGKYPQGHSRHVRFDKPGLVNVYCDIHSDMAAFVYVFEHGAFAQPAEDGTFALPSLRSGDYTVTLWHPDFGERSQRVHVPDDGDVTVALSF
jgi:plastocyanin